MAVKKLFWATCVIVMAGFTAQGFAQQGGGQDWKPAPPPQQQEISDSKLALYAKAEQKVNEVRQELQQQMQGAANQEEARKMQIQAQEKMVDGVTSLGMTVEEYNTITNLLQRDPSLRERLQNVR